MAEIEFLYKRLIEAQNPDGGWGYHNGTSWTEPTALAVLALSACGPVHSGAADTFSRGAGWLLRLQRLDGGWPPQPSVPVSTWVTSVAILALSEIASIDSTQAASRWLLSQIRPSINPKDRLTYRLLGISPPVQPAGGSPWFPGTAAWVAPTALSVLALSDAARKQNSPQLLETVREAQNFILSRRCRDGGWNHGGGRYRSEDANSYPEMTGMALLALREMPVQELQIPLKRAQAFLETPGSVEALSWLQLGLLQHGHGISINATDLPCRTTRDVSLRLLALTGASSGNRLLMPLSRAA